MNVGANSVRVLLAATVFFSAMASAGEVEPTEMKRLVVTLTPGAESIAHLVDGATASRFANHEVVLVPQDQAEAAKKILDRHPEVRSVEADERGRPPEPEEPEVSLAPSTPVMTASTTADEFADNPLFNDPGYPEQAQWRDHSDAYPGASGIESAFLALGVNKTLRIAYLDTGFQGNGGIEWAGGYNFSTHVMYGPSERGPDHFITTPGDATCSNTHGHQVASINHAKRNAGVGIAGMLDSEAYGVRIGDCFDQGYVSEVAEGIYWAAGDDGNSAPVDKPMDLINISWGTDDAVSCPSFLQEAIDFANDSGAIVVASAGNNGTDDSSSLAPANCDGVVAVAATDIDGRRAAFTSYGSNVDFAALGESVQTQFFSETSNEITRFSANGTSFSAPNVVGMLGLVWQAIPELTKPELLEFAASSTVEITGASDGMGHGIVNANEMIQGLISLIDADVKVSHPLEGCSDQRFSALYGEDVDFCSLRDITLQGLELDQGQHAVVFEVPGGEPLRVENGSVFTASELPRFLVHGWDSESRYGLQICKEPTGEHCANPLLISLSLESESCS